MPRTTWRVGAVQDASSLGKVAAKVERNEWESGGGYNHELDLCPLRLARQEEVRVERRRHSQEQRLATFQHDVSQRVKVLRQVRERADLSATECEVQRRDHFVEQNIVMAHNPGRYNSLLVRVNRQQTLSKPIGNSAGTHDQPPIAVQQSDASASDNPCTQSVLQDRAIQVCSARDTARRLLVSQSSPGTAEDQLDIQPQLSTQVKPTKLSFDPTWHGPYANEPLQESLQQPLRTAPGRPLPGTGSCDMLPRPLADHSTSAGGACTSSQSQPCLVSHVRPIHVAAVLQKPPTASFESRVPVSRRLFMDLERAQVQERRRQRQLQEQVQRVLQRREDQRQAMEVQERLDKGGDPVSVTQAGHLPGDNGVRNDEPRGKAARTHQDMARYVDALRERVRQRAQHTALPPICGCADAAWLSHPSTCASNCPFHHNPHEYSKALVRLLATQR